MQDISFKITSSQCVSHSETDIWNCSEQKWGLTTCKRLPVMESCKRHTQDLTLVRSRNKTQKPVERRKCCVTQSLVDRWRQNTEIWVKAMRVRGWELRLWMKSSAFWNSDLTTWHVCDKQNAVKVLLAGQVRVGVGVVWIELCTHACTLSSSPPDPVPPPPRWWGVLFGLLQRSVCSLWPMFFVVRRAHKPARGN